MRVRHRIPSIFNLSMVDVLCCALGCVILLWLINLREAKYHQDSAAEQNHIISERLAGMSAERDTAFGALMRLEMQIETIEAEKTSLQSSLSSKQAEAAEMSRRLKTSAKLIAALERDLRAHMSSEEEEKARADELTRKLKDAAKRVASLEDDLRDSEKRGERETERSRELAEELAAAKRRLKNVQATANLVPTLRADLKEAREQYSSEKALAAALEKEIAQRLRQLKDVEQELASARRSMASLENEKQTLVNEAARVRAAAENRFAGIALTGRRVLFLVDMSGSMDLVDENTPAPTKWTDVRNTVARLMRSIPDLEKYQVIVFAEKAEFLFKGDADWLAYDSRSSPERALLGLAAIKPKGGTNMYAALEAAFRLRAKGLDTIYLLSDGLPNLGEGVNPDTLNTLKDIERNDVLARYIRKTLNADWNRPLPDRPRVRINTIGFFYESPEVGAFLWALARENDGSFVGMSKP
jgi:hypothetical protein